MKQDNIMYARKPRQNSWIYKLLLFLSFVWLEFYPTTTEFMYTFQYGFGNIFSDANFSAVLGAVISNAIISWICFEILFWVYRWVLSFKIYSFIVPLDSLRAETRLYFVYRNIILGIVYNFCFLFPYLYIYSIFFDILITITTLICFAKHLNSVYSESVVGHFVFKNFCYPIFIYELIEIICSVWAVLA